MQEPALKTAERILLQESSLETFQLQNILQSALGKNIDSADLFLQSVQQESWLLENGIVRSGDFSADHGFGLRVISGEKTGFAYAQDISLPALNKAVNSARSIVRLGGEGQLSLLPVEPAKRLYLPINPLTTCTDQEKIDLLQQIDKKIRARDPRITQVVVQLSARYETVLVLQSSGELAADTRPLVSLSIRVIAEEGTRREQGSAGLGARRGYDFFTQNDLEPYIDKAVGQALRNLTAIAAPAGSMTVVLGPGWPAVLLHEAIGHGLEGDFNRKQSSAYSNLLGEKVASSLCTIVDDGTIPERRGSLSIDDEGMPTQCTVLIENGVLKNYMQDRLNARLMKMKPTGNGRRESYAQLPLPRMTNTYMLPGESDPQEIIASVKKGIYAVDFAGGQVDITSGKFVFSMSEAYLIENGRVTRPIKGATLIGDGPDVLTRVSMVGNDLQLDSGIGSCGKEGQTLPVGVGQPTLKIDQVTVGGSANDH